MGPIATRRLVRSARHRVVAVVGLAVVLLAIAAHHGHLGCADHHEGSETAQTCLQTLAIVGAAAVVVGTAAHALAWPRFRLAHLPAVGPTTPASAPAARARAGPCPHAALCVWRR